MKHLFHTFFLIPLAACLYLCHQRVAREVSIPQPHSAIYDTIILGDSHCAYAVDSSLLPGRYYMAGKDGMSIREMYLITVALKKQHPSFTNLVLLADDHVFAPYRLKYNQMEHVVDYGSYSDFRNLFGVNWTYPGYLMRRISPLFNPKDQLVLQKMLEADLARLLGRYHPPAEEDYGKLTQDQRVTQAAYRVEYQMGHESTDPILADYYLRLCAFCHAEGIILIGVRYPVADEYQALQASRSAPAAVDPYFRAARFTSLLDYSDLYSGHPDRFTNADHINPAAAHNFTPRLVSDLQPLLSTPKSPR
jgi:hypothetical protein